MSAKDNIFDLGILKVANFSTCWCVYNIHHEIVLRDEYRTKRIDFKAGDIVIDVGANVGITSMWLAKTHPYIKIYSFEPNFRNFKHFQKNLGLNDIQNVEAFNLAVTADGRNVKIGVDEFNTGGASIYKISDGDKHVNECKSINLDQFIEERGIERIKFLKMDCEGAEYEILPNFRNWSKVEYLSIEIHGINNNGREKYQQDKLVQFVERKISADKLTISLLS
jgi:FkbM family methyltransferase